MEAGSFRVLRDHRALRAHALDEVQAQGMSEREVGVVLFLEGDQRRVVFPEDGLSFPVIGFAA